MTHLIIANGPFHAMVWFSALTFAIPMLIALLAGWIYGMFLLITGIRGRKIDQHPLCKKCRFDLTGRDDTHDKCSECGADLQTRGAIVHGNRARHPGRIVRGSVLLVVLLLIITPFAIKALSRVNWASYLPIWTLRMQTVNDTRWADAAWGQLLHRLYDKQLSDAKIQMLIKDAMTLQADTTRPWQVGAGSFFETAWCDRKVSSADWKTYARTALTSSLEVQVRPNVNIGAAIPVSIRNINSRMAIMDIICLYKQGEFSIDGTVVNRLDLQYRTNLNRYVKEGCDYHVDVPDSLWMTIAPGKHTLKIKARALLHDWRTFMNTPPYIDKMTVQEFDALQDVAYCDWELELPFEVIPADFADAQPVTIPPYPRAMDNVITTTELKYSSKYLLWELKLQISSMPVNLACDVVAVAGDQRCELLSLCFNVAMYSRSDFFRFSDSKLKPLLDMGVDKIDLHLIPNGKVAQNTVNIKEYWGLPIVIKDVPLNKGDASLDQ